MYSKNDHVIHSVLVALLLTIEEWGLATTSARQQLINTRIGVIIWFFWHWNELNCIDGSFEIVLVFKWCCALCVLPVSLVDLGTYWVIDCPLYVQCAVRFAVLECWLACWLFYLNWNTSWLTSEDWNKNKLSSFFNSKPAKRKEEEILYSQEKEPGSNHFINNIIQHAGPSSNQIHYYKNSVYLQYKLWRNTSYINSSFNICIVHE